MLIIICTRVIETQLTKKIKDIKAHYLYIIDWRDLGSSSFEKRKISRRVIRSVRDIIFKDTLHLTQWPVIYMLNANRIRKNIVHDT